MAVVFMNKQGKFFRQDDGDNCDFTFVDDLQQATQLRNRLVIKYPVLKECVELKVRTVSSIEIVIGD